MKKPKSPKPRNPFVQHIVVKKSGAHGKTKKAHRRTDNMSFTKQQKDGFE